MTVWKGTQEESVALTLAAGNNCECRMGDFGRRIYTCPSHLLIEGDQKQMDHLLFARRIVARLKAEEGLDQPTEPMPELPEPTTTPEVC